MVSALNSNAGASDPDSGVQRKNRTRDKYVEILMVDSSRWTDSELK